MDHVEESKRWINTFRGEAMVEFSRDAGCWVYLCPHGCYGYDYESTWEAEQAFNSHQCRVSEPPC